MRGTIMLTDPENLCETCQHLGENIVRCHKCKKYSNYDQKDPNPFPVALVAAGVVMGCLLIYFINLF